MLRQSIVAAILVITLPSAGWTQDSKWTAEVIPGLSATVVALKRLPGKPIVQLDYSITNNGSGTVDLDEAGLTGMSGLDGLNRIGLLDFENKRVYEVGSADGCLCSTLSDEKLGAGASVSGWAWFMPPETVQGPLSVRFGGALPIIDVPLQ